MSEKKIPLQDTFLNALRKERTQVAIYLTNGIRLVGRIDSFDAYVILLKSDASQLIYKHAIATVVPTGAVSMPDEEIADGEADQARTSPRRTPVVIRKRSRELA